MSLSAHLLRYYIGSLFILLLQACSPEQAQQEYYTYERLPEATWHPSQRYTFPLLVTDRSQIQHAALLLRIDSRLDRPSVRLQAQLQWRGEALHTDTLSLELAPQAGQWKSPGIVYHDYTATLARPLQAPRTGLYQLEVSLLDSLPLKGVAQLGIHTWRSHPEAGTSATH